MKVEIDADELTKLRKIVSAETSQPRIVDGILQSPGCGTDYGCCSKSFDLIAFVDDLDGQLRELAK